jgi:hypothetical protein
MSQLEGEKIDRFTERFDPRLARDTRTDEYEYYAKI